MLHSAISSLLQAEIQFINSDDGSNNSYHYGQSIFLLGKLNLSFQKTAC